MKKLEELGISPAPWKVAHWYEKTTGKPYSNINTSSGFYVADGTNDADKCLIAAAPELYEALRMYQDAFEEIRKSAWFLDANFSEIMQLNKVMNAAEAALAKAAGESEVGK